MPIIDVTMSQMQNAQKQLLDKVDEYNATVGKVASAAAELCGQWEGDARASFQAEQAEALAFYREMAGRASWCANMLAQAVAQYSAADHAASEMIKAANH